MSHLKALAKRFVDEDGLSDQERDKITTDAAECKSTVSALTMSYIY